MKDDMNTEGARVCLRIHRRWLYTVIPAIIMVVLCFSWLIHHFGKTSDLDIDQRDLRVQAEYAKFLGRWQGQVTGEGWPSSFPTQDCYFIACGKDVIWCRVPCPTGRLIVDPTTVPKRLNVVSDDWYEKGIYKLDGDLLQICVAVFGREHRPTSFSSDANRVCVYNLRRAKPESVEYYERKLSDRDFIWRGPAPYGSEWDFKVAPAAFALAFIGDAAVPALFRATKNPAVDVRSVCVALDAIGIPTKEFREELRRRDTQGVEKWWAENRKRTAVSRSKMRIQWELPPVEGVDWQAITRQPEWSQIAAITVLSILLVAVAWVVVLTIRRRRNRGNRKSEIRIGGQNRGT